MDKPRTFTEIMSNPRRAECEARFLKRTAELSLAAYKADDIIHACIDAALHHAMKENAYYHGTLLRRMEEVGRTGSLAIQRARDERVGLPPQDSY